MSLASEITELRREVEALKGQQAALWRVAAVPFLAQVLEEANARKASGGGAMKLAPQPSAPDAVVLQVQAQVVEVLREKDADLLEIIEATNLWERLVVYLRGHTQPSERDLARLREALTIYNGLNPKYRRYRAKHKEPPADAEPSTQDLKPAKKPARKATAAKQRNPVNTPTLELPDPRNQQTQSDEERHPDESQMRANVLEVDSDSGMRQPTRRGAHVREGPRRRYKARR